MEPSWVLVTLQEVTAKNPPTYLNSLYECYFGAQCSLYMQEPKYGFIVFDSKEAVENVLAEKNIMLYGSYRWLVLKIVFH